MGLSPQGCFEHIENAVNSYTWGISWFGFAILMLAVSGGAWMPGVSGSEGGLGRESRAWTPGGSLALGAER